MNLRSIRSFGIGLLLTLFASGVSYAVSKWGYDNPYYFAQMLAVFIPGYILLAWLLYLRKTGFLAMNPKSRVPDALGHRHDKSDKDLPEDKVSGAELIITRDENGLVQRIPEKRSGRVESHQSLLENPIAPLLWSAMQVAALATALYEFWGVGKSFYR